MKHGILPEAWSPAARHSGSILRGVGLTLLAAAMASCVSDTWNEPSDTGADRAQAADDLYVGRDGLPTPDTTCAAASMEAKQTPAAVLILLDRSSSMSTNNKWSEAQQAIVKAIDKSSFDNLELGLLAYPSFTVAGPSCLLGWPVSCGVSALPQVPLANSGGEKTNGSSGPRKDIYKWFTASSPDTTGTDASPGYSALKNGISALQSLSLSGHRILVMITDGGFSCASLSSPTRPGYSDGICPDWEYPDTVISLLKGAYGHATTPVHSFFIGVPGSNSTGQKQGPYATAPYYMRLALSAYAYAGSPKTVPAGCTGTSFSKTGGDPQVPCHFDLTVGTFNADALALAIGNIRGQVLGCTYKLPKVDDKNVQIDKNRVNVRVTLDSAPAVVVPRRKDVKDTCLTSGCWDLDSAENVVLLGKACTDLAKASQVKVEILVGCKTILK